MNRRSTPLDTLGLPGLLVEALALVAFALVVLDIAGRLGG